VAQAVDPEIRSSDFGLDLVIPENTTVRVVYRAADGTESTPQPLVTRTQLNAALSAQQAQMQTLLVCVFTSYYLVGGVHGRGSQGGKSRNVASR
jgi:hypothetical protein